MDLFGKKVSTLVNKNLGAGSYSYKFGSYLWCWNTKIEWAGSKKYWKIFDSIYVSINEKGNGNLEVANYDIQ